MIGFDDFLITYLHYCIFTIYWQNTYSNLSIFSGIKCSDVFFLWTPPTNILFGLLHVTLNSSRKCPSPTVSADQTPAAHSVSHVDTDSSLSCMCTHTQTHTDTKVELSKGLKLIYTLKCSTLCHEFPLTHTHSPTQKTLTHTGKHTLFNCLSLQFVSDVITSRIITPALLDHMCKKNMSAINTVSLKEWFDI